MTSRSRCPPDRSSTRTTRRGQGGPRYESDYAFFKPGADVMAVGSFHAPGGKPVREGRATVEVGRQRSELAVVGERFWEAGLLRSKITDPKPFRSLELRWQHAFGGPSYAANPVGVGHLDKERKKAGQPVALPRIELADQRVATPKDSPAPGGFGPLPQTWELRRSLMGTLDDRWQQKRWPWFPEDLDWAHFQSAAPGLRLKGHLVGDEALFFENLHPEHPEFETRLPGLGIVAARQVTVDGRTRLDPIEMNLDTVWVDVEAERAVLAWRGWCPVADDELTDIDYLWGALVPAKVMADEQRTLQLAADAIREEEAQWEIGEEQPAPAADDVDEPPADEPQAAPALPEELQTAMAAVAALPKEPVEETAPTEEAQAAGEQKVDEWLAEAEREDESEPAWDRQRVREALGRGESLSGQDLSGIDLSDESLRGADLSGALLNGSVLSNADLGEANLTGASLSGATLHGTRLVGAALNDADLSGSRGDRIDGDRCNLSGANLSGVEWNTARLNEAMLLETELAEARLENAELQSAQLEEANLEGATLDGGNLRRVRAKGCSFLGASLQRARLDEAELPEADFSEGNLTACSLREANLADATFESTDASRSTWSGARIQGMRGAGITLSEATLDRVEGEDPIFSDARMPGATLEHASIPGADFSGAQLRGATIEACELKGARFVKADLEGATLSESNCFEALFEGCRLQDCDGSGTSFYGAEFLDADVDGFRGAGRNLTMTKLAEPSEGRR